MSRLSIVALVIFVVATALVLTMRTPAASKLQAGVLQVVKPFHTTTSGVGRSLGAFGTGLKTLEELERENGILRVENEKLRATNQHLNDLAEQNNRLNEALGFKKRSNFNLVPARIIARSSATWWSSVQIDRGEQDGLDSDMPVVTDVGLVGKTTTVGPTTAYVVLVSDENCKVAATVENTREQAILSGERTGESAQPECVLSVRSKNAPLQAGQKVFSAGVSGGVFPTGLLLGTIKDFQTRALDTRATVIPAVDLARLENVFIVRGTRPAPTVLPATRP